MAETVLCKACLYFLKNTCHFQPPQLVVMKQEVVGSLTQYTYSRTIDWGWQRPIVVESDFCSNAKKK